MEDERIPLQPNQPPTTNKYTCTPSVCPKSILKPQSLKSKPAILVLFWNTVVLLTFLPLLEPDIIISFLSQVTIGKGNVVVFGSTAFVLMFFPVAGFAADVCFGRFKTIKCSLWNLWITVSVAVCISILSIGIWLGGLLSTDSQTIAFIVVITILAAIMLISLIVSYVLFSANVIQFGLDQLQDGSESESSFFVYWFVWVYHLILCLYKFSASSVYCSASGWTRYLLILVIGFFGFVGYIALPVTLCLIHHQRFQRWFVIEPGANNPYKLVYKVIKFALKHDRPLQRSAFTYCEDELPSRLDLGKSKYGGPFTTEEVENVKTFGRIVRVLLTVGLIFMLELAATGSLSNFFMHLDFRVYNQSDSHHLEENETEYSLVKLSSTGRCTAFVYPKALSSLIIVILIPLYIYLLRPYYLRCCYSFGNLKRLGVSIILYTLSLVVSFAMDTAGHYNDNGAICMFTSDSLLSEGEFSGLPFSGPVPLSSINSNLIVIQIILNALATLLFYTAAYEFICVQSPHTMKGFIIGTFFAIKGLFKFIGVAALLFPFSFYWNIDNKRVTWLSCGFAYYLLNILIAMVGFVVFIFVARGYHYRQRDEPSNIHQYAENYYSNIQDEPSYDYDDLDEHEVYSVRSNGSRQRPMRTVTY